MIDPQDQQQEKEPSRYADRGEPTNLTAVTTRIRQLAKDQGVDENRLRHRLAVVVLADIMSTVAGPNADDEAGREERFLIKGGTAETIEVPGMSVKPRRAQVKMTFKGKPYSTVQLEIAAAEGSAAEEFDLLTSDDMVDLGFSADTKQQEVMTVRYQVAQKLHACTTRSDRPNDRTHDLVDIALLADFVRQDPAAIREACVEVFGIRARHPWPPVLIPESHWPSIYARAALGLDGVAPATLDEALVLVSELIDLVENSAA